MSGRFYYALLNGLYKNIILLSLAKSHITSVVFVSGCIKLKLNYCNSYTRKAKNIVMNTHSKLNLTIQQEINQVIFSRQEDGCPHNPYDQEKREMDSIRLGDPELLERSLKEAYVGKVGILAKNPVRQAKNIAICVIVLASRAAIEGGLPSEQAFSMADGYILKIEEFTEPDAITSAMRSAEFDFANAVKLCHTTSQNETNELVERAKNYIFQHLHEPFQLKKLSAALGINPSYFSSLFHQKEGLTLSQYIRREKIRLSKNLLKYSNYEIGEIAHYFAFCSQSHFGANFKKETGMTPVEYRNKFGVVSENSSITI